MSFTSYFKNMQWINKISHPQHLEHALQGKELHSRRDQPKTVGLKWPLLGNLLIYSFVYPFIQLTLIFSLVPHTVQGDGDAAANDQALVPVCLDLTFLKPNQNLSPPVWERFVSTVSPGDFPGCPVVKTLCFQCRGCGFNPWSGN